MLANSLCSLHYQRMRNYGRLVLLPKVSRQCSIADCERQYYAVGLCHTHWLRKWKHGDPQVRIRRRKSTEDRSYIQDGIGYIELPGGLWALVDAEDFNRVTAYRWQRKRVKHAIYACTEIRNVGEEKRWIMMHRFVMNARPNEEVDHVHWNGLDNRKDQLRIATRNQQMQNTRISARNTTGYKGVSRRGKRFGAGIRHHGIQHYLGYFADRKDAARAYNRKARELGFLYVPSDPD